MSKYKDKIKHGDLTRIAELTGYTQNYVARVLSYGDRKSETLERVAEEYFNHRDGLKTSKK